MTPEAGPGVICLYSMDVQWSNARARQYDMHLFKNNSVPLGLFRA